MELLFKVSFSGWVLVLMGLFLTKKKIQEIALLEIKCPHNKTNFSIESIITDKIFYIVLKKHKKNIFQEGTSLY